MSTEVTSIDLFRGTLTKMRSEIQTALPAQIPAERFIRTTITAVQMNPGLLDADRRSLLGACMKAAQDGLLVDGREAAIVVYRTKEGPRAQYMPMVAGLLKKIRNSGELLSISAHVVYSRDEFDYVLGDDERIIHKPFLGEERGHAIAVYAIAKTKDGGVYREVMTSADVEKVRQASRYKDSGPWVHWWDEMAKKTVIRRLAKRLPSSADLDQLLQHDLETSGFTPGFVQEPTQQSASQERPAALSRLKQAMAQRQAAEEDAIDASYEVEELDAHDAQDALQQGDAVPTIQDAYEAMKKGDLDLARDIARSLPEDQRKGIEVAIANAEKRKP